MKHLIDFGNQRIGYFSGQLQVKSMRARYEALRNAMKSADVSFNKEIVAEAQFTQPISNDVLTLVEAAALLKCCPKTLRKQASAGKVPGKRIGSLWRFYRPVLEGWLREAA